MGFREGLDFAFKVTIGINMKKISLLVLLVINSFFMVAKGEIDMRTQDEDTYVSYMGRFNFNNMHCLFRVNGLVFTTSASIAPKEWGLRNITFSDDIGGLLQEGMNSIEVEGIQILSEPTPGTSSYCEFSVTASAVNRVTGEQGSKEVTHVRISLDKEGKFTAEESRDFGERSVTDTPVLIELDEKTAKQDWINNDTIVKRNLKINHPHHSFAWVNAKPFENTPENRARVWQAYDQLREAFARKDRDKIEALLLPAAQERDLYTGYTGEGSRRLFEMMVVYDANWDDDKFEMIPINKQDYELQIAEHQKLFRLSYKGGFVSSPIAFKSSRGDRIYNFYFAEIDGKIRVAIL